MVAAKISRQQNGIKETRVNESCCAVSCHAQSVCKEAVSEECSVSPVECATGDTVQFIIQPQFNDLNKQFLCHIRRQQPDSIFRLSYYIAIPTPDGWNSSKREVDLPSTGESQATQISDYIRIKYNNYLQTVPDGEMLLRGDLITSTREYGFTLLDFKPTSEFNRTKVKAKRYATEPLKETTNAEIQNERPFDISTINFNSKHGCYADTSKIHGKQLMYDSDSGQKVQAPSVRTRQGFTYNIRSLDSTPTIDFFLPGNQSVLYYYFPNSTLNYKTVSIQLLNKQEQFYIYTIDISGSMFACNSYLGIDIYDKTTESTVVVYDALVFCTSASLGLPTFNFQIKLPDKGSKDKLLRVTLRDSHTSVSYFVTTYSYKSSLMQNNTIQLSTSEPKTLSQPAAFFAMLLCLGAIGFAFGLTYVLISYRVIIIARFRSSKDRCAYAKSRQRLLVTAYCVVKLVYSVLFSLTMLMLLLKIVCKEDLDKVKELPEYHVEVKHLVERNIQAITEFKQNEMKRQHEMQSERLDACSGYATIKINELQKTIKIYSSKLKREKNGINNKKFQLLMSEIVAYLETTRNHVDQHKKEVDSHITDILTDYNALLEEMITNDWVQLPFLNYKSLKNRTVAESEGSLLDPEAVDFLAYIGVDRPASALHQINILNEQLQLMYDSMVFNIDFNFGLGILRGLDTSSVSMLSLKQFATDSRVNEPAFSIESGDKLETTGWLLFWVIIVGSDILLFIYRICCLTNTVYRLKHGYAEEVEDNSSTKSLKKEKLEVEMTIIKRQIDVDGEMSRSLLEDEEKPDENLNYEKQESRGQESSRAPSLAAESVHTDIGTRTRRPTRQHSRAYSEAESITHSDMERSRPRGSEVGSVGRLSRKQRSRIQSEAEVSTHYSDLEQPQAKGSEKESIGGPGSAFSESTTARGKRLYRSSKNTSRANSTTGSTQKLKSMRTRTSVGYDESEQTLTQTGSNRSATSEETTSSTNSLHPGGCAATRLARILLSKYTVPAILWLACQILATILISLLSEIVTYRSLVQATNIDSMISHVGMYTSVVNSYLTTHAQLVSRTAQETLVNEFNLHLHHIAKVKAILENDLNWSVLDYHNRQCVLDGKLVQHCPYDALDLDVNVMPCQSFPIEAVQYTDRDGLNANLVSSRMLEFTNALLSLITMSICMITFYINAIAIVHILSLLINKILQQRGFIHMITVSCSRGPVSVLEPVQKPKREFASTPTLLDSEPNTSHHTADYGRSLLQESEPPGSNNFQGEEEDPLLKTIKAQHSLSRLTDDMSDASALRSPKIVRAGRASTSFNQSASEAEF
ncbi:uncharacterized protein [Watersipora subatra]|uniref:uncharacterized protein n=1 Tax=Watersipora subatra TaxID=2589382 RepID=UPI00355BD44C